MNDKDEPTTPEERARSRAEYLSDLIWHAGTFVIINGFLWFVDLNGDGDANWAYWITAGWGIGLAFHALAYLVDGRSLEDRKTEEFLADELRRSNDQPRPESPSPA